MADKMKVNGVQLSEPVQGLVERFQRVQQYWAPAVVNMHENWRFYWGLYPHLGQGQWPAASIPKMIQSGRQLTQYNFILPIVDSLRAVITKVPTEPTYIALDETAKSLSEIAMHMIHSDMELMDWDADFDRFVLFGLISQAVLKMIVSDQYNPLGNIGFENCAQGSVFFDPLWKSGKRKDLKRVYKKTWMSAEEIYRTYKLDRAGAEAGINRMHGEQYGPYLGININEYSSDQLGTMHDVIEEYFMLPVTKKVEIISGPDGNMEMPEIDDRDKPAYLDAFFPGWDKTMVYEEEYRVEECFVRTGCPTLAGQDLLVDRERTEVQIGSPPFFTWAANMINGQFRGVVDSLKDAQTNINFIEAEVIRKIQTEGGGGSAFVDESLFRDKRTAELFRRNRNRPDVVFPVKPGSLRKGLTPAVPVSTTGVPAEMYQNLRHIQNEVLPNIGKRPPVTMGQTDRDNQTSGKLFQLMTTEADNQVESMIKDFRYVKNDIYEAYLIQAGQTYSNEMIPREFTHAGKTLTANEPVELRSGDVIIRNDVRALLRQRHKIIISETQASPSQRARTANHLIKYMQVLSPENVGTRAIVNSEIIKNIEEMDEDTKARLDEMAELEADLAKSKLRLERASVEMQLMQIEQAIGVAQPTPQAQIPKNSNAPTYELPSSEEPSAEDNELIPQEGVMETLTKEVT